MPVTSGVAPRPGERPRVSGPWDTGTRLPRPADAWPFARPWEIGLQEQTLRTNARFAWSPRPLVRRLPAPVSSPGRTCQKW